MGEGTAISWTDHTFNPWWGCARVSPGCQRCYAETLAKRYGHELWGKHTTRRFFGDRHWREPLRWNADAERQGEPQLVFCSSMADVFEDRDDLLEPRARLWDLVAATPYLVWQLLTKRPENVIDMVPAGWHGNGFADHPQRLWPRNVWIGTTVEDQQRADERLPMLCDIPAPVRFASCEPLLDAVDITPFLHDSDCYLLADGDACSCSEPHEMHLDWVIVGGESGPRFRPLNLDHARSIVAQCEAASVPVFFKQVGGQWSGKLGDRLDGRTIKQFPAGFGVA